MKAIRTLLALVLSTGVMTGLVACDTSREQASADNPGQINAILSDYSVERSRVLDAMGTEYGVEFQTSDSLDRSAARHALDLARRREFSHIGRDGSSPWQRLRDAGAGMTDVREYLFDIQGTPEDLAERALATWQGPVHGTARLEEGEPAATHAAVAFAPVEDGGYVGVLLLATR